jgi:VWFA-related protein
LLIVALAAPALAEDTPSPPGDEPRPSGIIERAGRELVQLDVTVTGPAQAIADLTRDDFELVVGGRPIDEFLVDRLCRIPESAPEPLPGPDTAALATAPPRAPTTYLFYFDQHHLTAAGRQNSLDTTRRLVPELIHDGDRAMIVSAGMELATVAELTDDPQVLLDAVDGLEADRRQWDPFPYQEDLRIRHILDALHDSDTDHAISLARLYQREERFHTEKALRIFGASIGRLGGVDPPKVAIYFADTMRRNAGAHYLSFFSESQQRNRGALRAAQMDSFSAATPFDRAIEEAAAHGVRVYTVQAEGLVGDSSLVRATPQNRSNRQRVRDAQNSLVGMALESGGRGFINGVPAPKIAERILSDMACVYLLSFDAGDLRRDSPLPVRLVSHPPDVEAQARGTLVIQSESRRATSRLLTAFASPATMESDLEIRGAVIPVGFENGAYRALVQVAVPGSPIAGARWDVGASLVSSGEVRDDASGQVTVSGPRVTVVFEREMHFSPGPYELIFVARESETRQVGRASLEGSWPEKNEGPVLIGPIVVIQPAEGAFFRDGDVRDGGALAVAEQGWARTDRPTALVALVCRGSSKKKTWQVERRLSGDSSADFPPTELDLADERCAQIRDLVPTGTMTEGRFRYTVRVIDRSHEIAASTHSFTALGPDSLDEAGSPAQPLSNLQE